MAKSGVVNVLSVLSVLVFTLFPPDAASYHTYLSPETAPEADNVAVEPIQINPPVVVGIAGRAFIVKLTPLSAPVIAGLLLTTLILYPEPKTVSIGIIAEIIPADVDVNVPIVTADAKLPLAFDNWAVKIFPLTKVPVIVKGTETDAPAQNGEPAIVPVIIVVVFLEANTKARFAPIAFEPVTPLMPAVPANVVYWPAIVVLPAITSLGLIAVGRVAEIELFVKFPTVANDQYSVLLIEFNVASTVPTAFAGKASICAVTTPVPVVGFTNENGKYVEPLPIGKL